MPVFEFVMQLLSRSRRVLRSHGRALLVGAPLVATPPAYVIATTGCAGFLAAAPTVAAITSDAVAVLGMVQSAVSAYYQAHPADPGTQAKIAAGIAKAQQALVFGEQALASIENATQGQTVAAFASFAQAWNDLMALVAPLGIVPAPAQPGVLPVVVDGGVRAVAPVTTIPVPLVLRAR